MIDKEHKFCIGKDDHSWEVGYDKGYQQGKADGKAEVIDEFVRAINSRLLRFVPTDYDDILFIAEQLKKGNE